MEPDLYMRTVIQKPFCQSTRPRKRYLPRPGDTWKSLVDTRYIVSSETHVKMRLMENFRAIFYAPYYAACTLGFYANQGVDVELVSSDAPGDAIAHLSNGTIGLTWGGPIRVMTAHD